MPYAELPDGAFMTSDESACRGWPGWGSLLMWRTRFSTTSPEPSRVSQRCTSATNSWRSARKRLKERVGDLVLWDNRCTMHRRDAFDPEERRIMHRTQVKGELRPA